MEEEARSFFKTLRVYFVKLSDLRVKNKNHEYSYDKIYIISQGLVGFALLNFNRLFH
jgi:hypothetical protein